MKKVILAAIAVFGLGLANAQDAETGSGFKKGDGMVQGGFGFSTIDEGDDKRNYFYVAPRVGYFFSKNFVAGISLGYESAKREEVGSFPINKSNSFGVGAFGRYYATPSNKFSFFGEVAFGIFNSSRETIFANNTQNFESKSGGFSIGLAPGVSYFISKNFALETSIGVLNYRVEEVKDVPNSEPTTSFDLGFDTTRINLGLVYRF